VLVSTDEVLDPAVVAELRRAQEAYGNPEFIRQLVALFQTNTPGKMARVREAVAARDAGTIEQVAHALGTNCGMLGATRMAQVCARMEEAARRADVVEAGAAFREAEALLPGVLEALSTL
jgi:HPt (histidine-containing phosphotransfer) domain-containing protein